MLAQVCAQVCPILSLLLPQTATLRDSDTRSISRSYHCDGLTLALVAIWSAAFEKAPREAWVELAGL